MYSENELKAKDISLPIINIKQMKEGMNLKRKTFHFGVDIRVINLNVVSMATQFS
jgi:hypothetical protein